MRKYLLLLGFIAFSLNNSFAQRELSDYDYVVVPKKFEFLFEEDQHQLNSMTKFLFNKYGFNAFYEDELPNVTRCDGLRAEVIGTPGFIYTKIVVVLRDCYGSELFRSPEGKSKFKEYRKGYQDALRKAFESIQELEVQQKELTVYADLKDAAAKTAVVENQSQGGMNAKSDDSATTTAITASTGARYLPVDRFSYYTSENSNYLLRKTDEGYALYLETEEKEDGLMLQGRIYRIGSALKYRTADNQSQLIVFKENKDFTLVNGDQQQDFKYISQ